MNELKCRRASSLDKGGSLLQCIAEPIWINNNKFELIMLKNFKAT